MDIGSVHGRQILCKYRRHSPGESEKVEGDPINGEYVRVYTEHVVSDIEKVNKCRGELISMVLLSLELTHK